MSNALNLIVNFKAVDKLTGALKNIMQGSKGTIAGIRQTQAELKKLQVNQKAIDGFKTLKTNVRQTGTDLAAARAKASELGRALHTSDAPTKKMKQDFERARKEVEKLEKRLHDQTRALNQSRSGLDANGIATRNLAQHQRDLTSQIEAANKKLEQQKARAERTARMQARLGAVKDFGLEKGAMATAGVTLPILALAKTSIDQSREGAIAVAQVQASIASMGPVAQRSLEQLKQQSADLMHQSLFDDDDIMKNVTAKLLTFGKVTGTMFDRAQQAALDLSAKGFGPIESTSVMLGKALQDPIKGINAMSRAGVSFSAEQKAMARSMVEAGNIAGAQAMIMKEVEKQVGGAAKAARDADPAAALGLSFGELQQAIGDRLVPRLITLVDKVVAMMDAFGNLSPAMQDNILIFGAIAAVAGPLLVVIGSIAAAISALVTVGPVLATVFTAVTGPVGLFIAIMAGLALFMYRNWDLMKASALSFAQWVAGLWNGLINVAISVWTGIAGAFGRGINWVQEKLSTLASWMKSIGSMMMDGLLMALNPALLANRLLAVARGGITAFKNYFGIKSPSRLMMQMGGHVATGLAMGLDQGRGRPMRSMGRLAAGVAGAGALSLAGPAGAAPAAGTAPAAAARPIEIHIHQQPGESADELARRVAKLLERRGGGGNYGDDT